MRLVILAALFLTACTGPVSVPTRIDATALTQQHMLVDGHIDLPYALHDGWYDASIASEQGDFDFPRAMAGGLSTPFMSIYTPAKYDGTPAATEHANSMIDLVEKLVASAPEKFRVVSSVAEARTAFADGLIGLPLGMENGSPIQSSLELLDQFYARGIRYITLAHSKSNAISDSSYDDNRQWGGLSEFGKTVVDRMNTLGIMVDISHLSDDAAWQVLQLSKVPVIATHSSVRHFTPGSERNMSDEMIIDLGKRGGVIMINFGTFFLTEAGNNYGKIRERAYSSYLESEQLTDSAEIKASFRDEYEQRVPYPYATLDNVLDHIDHVVKLAGIDAVGIGSDYDGVGDSLPTGLKDVSDYPNLVRGLQQRGYSTEDIVKILAENVLRVWSEVEQYAASKR